MIKITAEQKGSGITLAIEPSGTEIIKPEIPIEVMERIASLERENKDLKVWKEGAVEILLKWDNVFDVACNNADVKPKPSDSKVDFTLNYLRALIHNSRVG